MQRLDVAVLGANGVYGRHLVPRLVARGHRVRALVRRPDAAGLARACGAVVRKADMFDGESLVRALDGCDVAVNIATSLPGPSGRGDFAANDELRRTGTPIWVAACKEARVGRMIQQSIGMVHATARPDDADAWGAEDAPFALDAELAQASAVAAALAMEDAVRASGIDGLILRGGLFYGPGTGRDEDWLTRAAAGKLKLPGDGLAYVSLIHIADMADVTLAAIERGVGSDTLIVCDDRPARWSELFAYVSALAGVPACEPGGRPAFASFRLSNARARDVLGWSPRYADFRSGLAR